MRNQKFFICLYLFIMFVISTYNDNMLNSVAWMIATLWVTIYFSCTNNDQP